MKAITYDRFGSIDVLKWAELPSPIPVTGQVLIAIRAVSINVIDSRVRSGVLGPLVNKKFPKIPGADFSGVVMAVAPDVRGLKKGDEVFGAVDPLKGGAFAESVAIAVDQIALKPASLSFEEAAALPVGALAALLSVRDLGRLERGGELLVHGASGGVGLFATQIAKQLGARVTAVAGTEGIKAVRSAGADVVIDYKMAGDREFSQLFDVIINASGKLPFRIGKQYLKPKGRLIEPSPTIPVFIGSKIANLFRRKQHMMLQTTVSSKDLAHLKSLVDSSKLRVVIAKTYPWTEFRQAFMDQEKGGTVGKIVLGLQSP